MKSIMFIIQNASKKNETFSRSKSFQSLNTYCQYFQTIPHNTLISINTVLDGSDSGQLFILRFTNAKREKTKKRDEIEKHYQKSREVSRTKVENRKNATHNYTKYT